MGVGAVTAHQSSAASGMPRQHVASACGSTPARHRARHCSAHAIYATCVLLARWRPAQRWRHSRTKRAAARCKGVEAARRGGARVRPSVASKCCARARELSLFARAEAARSYISPRASSPACWFEGRRHSDRAVSAVSDAWPVARPASMQARAAAPRARAPFVNRRKAGRRAMTGARRHCMSAACCARRSAAPKKARWQCDARVRRVSRRASCDAHRRGAWNSPMEERRRASDCEARPARPCNCGLRPWEACAQQRAAAGVSNAIRAPRGSHEPGRAGTERTSGKGARWRLGAQARRALGLSNKQALTRRPRSRAAARGLAAPSELQALEAGRELTLRDHCGLLVSGSSSERLAPSCSPHKTARWHRPEAAARACYTDKEILR